MDFGEIYRHGAGDYDALVQCEDAAGNLWARLDELVDWQGAEVVELGAGTGRLTTSLAGRVATVHAFDRAPSMLELAQRQCEALGIENVAVAQAEHRSIPLADHSADVVIEGWAFGHFVDFEFDRWETALGEAIEECERLVRPGGVIVLIETLGTGVTEPTPPTAALATLYERLEQHYGFERHAVRTDYRFPNASRANDLVGGFFGAEMLERLTGPDHTELHEVTGIWIRR